MTMKLKHSFLNFPSSIQNLPEIFVQHAFYFLVLFRKHYKINHVSRLFQYQLLTAGIQELIQVLFNG
jgi:hypothetical protein